jgi:hypothetical protein
MSWLLGVTFIWVGVAIPQNMKSLTLNDFFLDGFVLDSCLRPFSRLDDIYDTFTFNSNSHRISIRSASKTARHFCVGFEMTQRITEILRTMVLYEKWL